jgi:hypothetical protein
MSIHEILSDIQTRLSVPKGQTNSFGGYKYRSCEDILNAIKPFLKEHNATLTLSDELVGTQMPYHIKATATLYCGGESISVSALARESVTKKGMDDSQITGATSSYSRKYALNGLFAIDDTKDADATNKHNDEPDNDTLAKAQDALDQKDWAALCKLDREGGDDWLAVWKQIPSHKRSAMKKLMDKANEYRDLINDYDDKQDDDGILQLWEEMTKDGKSEVWRRITETAKNRITQLKKAA